MIRHLIKRYNYCGISSFKPGQMKKTFSISLLFLIIFSCSKPDDHLTSDCSHFSQSSTPIVCDGSICQSDTCQTYFGIWKEIFLAKNQMNQEYFDNHITLCNTGTFKNTQQGISFYYPRHILNNIQNSVYQITFFYLRIKLTVKLIIHSLVHLYLQ